MKRLTMNTSVSDNLTKSAQDFINIVWPAISSHPIVGGGKLTSIEQVDSTDWQKIFDLLSGIDAWQLLNGKGIRGIASRVQWKENRETFTIGFSFHGSQSTEYSKRLHAIKDEEDLGLLYPKLTIQAFLDDHNGNLLSACVINTKDLILEVEKQLQIGKSSRAGNGSDFGILTNPKSDKRFIYISWSSLLDKLGEDKVGIIRL